MVAWEQQIEEHSVPEWREKYVAYARLKRKLEKIEASMKASSSQDVKCSFIPKGCSMQLGGPYGATDIEELSDVRTAGLDAALLPELERLHEEFMDEVISELKKACEWYSGRVAKLESRTKKLCHMSGVAGAAGLGHRVGMKETEPEEVAELHLEAVRLAEYAMLNAEALRKIVKKFDKTCHTSFQVKFVERHLRRSALATAGSAKFDGERARVCRRMLEDIVTPERLQELVSIATQANAGAGLTKMTMRPHRILLSAIVGALTHVLGPHVLPGDVHAQRCLVLLFGVVCLWVSEAAPFEASAMLVPPLAVLLGVMDGEKQACAHKLLGAVFNDSLYLVLCGFVISSIVSRCQLDCRAAAVLQRSFGHRRFLFLLAVMFLGLSALLSNVTAPLLLIEVLKPLIRDLPTDSRYSRTLLLGLAFACNIGGMMTPIASPQNVAALQTLRASGGYISWSQWLAVSIPFCTIAVTMAWALLLMVNFMDYSEGERLRDASSTPKEKKKAITIPVVIFEREEMNTGKIVSLGCATLTLVAFAFAPVAEFFGGTANTALFFVAVALVMGWIKRQTFNAFSWHLLFLIGGGNALGLAVRESGLLAIVTKTAVSHLSSHPWLLIVELVAVLVAATTFVSHTVAALVLMPLVVELGQAAGVRELSVLIGALACSVACALPMTSFPNVNSLMAMDDNGQPWLGVKHFLLAGIPMTILSTLLLVTVGFELALLVCQ
eukprot:CAMPEP_0117490344 /NCGR_PEP_ID=MMETSP0784-20121206/17504_1 /TAXON_ID=39447 /ORGANISM="" /LENGTH=722 /DNA_ID=CAMNT_0005285103 /DNA_START=96 /DNA_END=2264 /DNA_ORIENTATION=-